MKNVNFLIEKTGTGYTAYAEAFGLLSTGKTLEQVREEAQAGLAEQCAHLHESAADYEVTFDYARSLENFRFA